MEKPVETKPSQEMPALDFSKIKLEEQPLPQPKIQQPAPEIKVEAAKPVSPPPIQLSPILEDKEEKPRFELEKEEPQPAPQNPNRLVIKRNIPPPEGMYKPINEDEEEKRRETFFSTLKQKLYARDQEHMALDSKSIMNRMKTYQEESMVKEKAMKEKATLDAELAETIMELELLEEGWYLLRKEIETKQILLNEKEKLIDKKILELKSLMDKGKVIEERIVPKDKWFMLKDGRTIKTVEELKSVLKNIEDHIFFHHVNDQKNDFSSWIRHVFEDHSLADKIIAAKTKEEAIRILEKA